MEGISKFRCMIFEGEAAAGSVMNVLWGAAAAFSNQLGAARPPAAAPAMLPAPEPAAAPRPEKTPARRPRAKKTAEPVREVAVREQELPAQAPVSRKEACLAAITEYPKTNQEIRAWMEERGFKADSNSVSQALFELRKANEVYKDEDLKWRLAGRPGK